MLLYSSYFIISPTLSDTIISYRILSYHQPPTLPYHILYGYTCILQLLHSGKFVFWDIFILQGEGPPHNIPESFEKPKELYPLKDIKPITPNEKTTQ